MREGVIIRNPGYSLLPTNESDEEIENLVSEMAQQNKTIALALRCHYFNRGSLRDKAKQLAHMGVKMSHTQFKYYVDLAHQWLAGRLSGKCK